MTEGRWGTDGRREAVRALVDLDLCPAVAIEMLAEYSWDFERELVVLTPDRLQHVLRAVQTGTVTAEQLTRWADAVEGREDIGFSPGALVDLVAEIASPELHGALEPEKIENLQTRISLLDGS